LFITQLPKYLVVNSTIVKTYICLSNKKTIYDRASENRIIFFNLSKAYFLRVYYNRVYLYYFYLKYNIRIIIMLIIMVIFLVINIIILEKQK